MSVQVLFKVLKIHFYELEKIDGTNASDFNNLLNPMCCRKMPEIQILVFLTRANVLFGFE